MLLRILLVALALVGGCQTSATTAAVPARGASSAVPSPPAPSQALATPDPDPTHSNGDEPLIVLGIREQHRRIAIVSRSPDDSWRSLNRRGLPCSSCTAGISSIPTAFVRTTLRCARDDGRRRIVASDVRGLDANYRPVTAVSSEPRDGLCELEVTVDNRAQDVERTTSFCVQPNTPIAKAAQGRCSFPAVTVPDALQVRVEEVTLHEAPGGTLGLVLGDGRPPDPPQLRVALDAVHGVEAHASVVEGELICVGNGKEQWVARAETTLDTAPPGDASAAVLPFDLRGDDVAIATCDLLVIETPDNGGASRAIGSYCFKSPARQERERIQARRRRARGEDEAKQLAAELGALSVEALEGGGMRQSFSVDVGRCAG